MSLELGMSMSIRQSLTQRLVVAMPNIQWSLLRAFQNGIIGPPPYLEPTFEEDDFTPRLKLEQSKIEGFESLSHIERMRLVDEANKVFRFAYTRGFDEDDKKKFYFKIPLMRDRNIMNAHDGIDKIKKRISRVEYERAIAMLESVGEMERIARAVPYYGLYQAVVKHLRRSHKIGLEQTVLVSIDRGGRLPCIILRRALGLTEMFSLKVDQGGGQLDEDKLEEFAKKGTFQDKHILLVDSTVDSGRQIRVLVKYFNSDTWRNRLGYKSWSIVGSNEYNQNHDHHCNVNWGVDPDNTFEDKPELMGIDYAPGTYAKVVERPTEASETIRKVLLSIPDGYIYVATDIDNQIEEQRKKWADHQKNRRTEHDQQIVEERDEHKKEVAEFKEQQKQAKAEDAERRKREKIERKLEKITSSKRWKKLVADFAALPEEPLPTAMPNGDNYAHHNVLVVGSGKQVDLPQSATQFVADNLGSHCSFFAGTSGGNPGAILKATLTNDKVAQPEVRLYQPSYMQGRVDDSFGGVPIMFVGEKDDMRRQMITDSNVVLTLGGAEGTLREVLLALDAGKPTVLIEGYGPVPAYVLATKSLRQKPSLKPCKNLVEAVQTILDMSGI
jgi:hypoxanthine phosphoribosyltransferase